MRAVERVIGPPRPMCTAFQSRSETMSPQPPSRDRRSRIGVASVAAGLALRAVLEHRL